MPQPPESMDYLSNLVNIFATYHAGDLTVLAGGHFMLKLPICHALVKFVQLKF